MREEKNKNAANKMHAFKLNGMQYWREGNAKPNLQKILMLKFFFIPSDYMMNDKRWKKKKKEAHMNISQMTWNNIVNRLYGVQEERKKEIRRKKQPNCICYVMCVHRWIKKKKSEINWNKKESNVSNHNVIVDDGKMKKNKMKKEKSMIKQRRRNKNKIYINCTQL